MNKKIKIIEEHNSYVDKVIEELMEMIKSYYRVFKQPKFWIFYILSMGTIAICYYLGKLSH